MAFKDALHTHYLRAFDKSEREQIADSSEPFYVNLEASGLSPDTGPVTARNVKVTVELSAAKAVRFDTTKGQATLRRQYSNCRYDKADAPTKAVCAFPGPLPAGAAYETDRPFTAAVAETGRQGLITYTVYPAPNTPADAQLPDSAPRGSGAPLGLRTVDGSLFTTYGRESAHGGVRFLTTRTQDRQVNGFTLKGQVGQTNDISVMDVNGYFEGDTYLTLPEGVSLGWHPSGEGHETLYCGYVDQKNRKVLCPAPLTDPAILRFRIDKRVEGAQGTISVKPDPEHPDPDLTNNTAPITMEYVD
ncbi:hypothetical protein HRD51_17710 [Streptomyces sp. A1-5]|nr:hypothetical protein HRD51_17710 [Streptomyces sp. A1-5]